MSENKMICHGHSCKDRKTCKWYKEKHVQNDNDKGNNDIVCEYYESKV